MQCNVLHSETAFGYYIDPFVLEISVKSPSIVAHQFQSVHIRTKSMEKIEIAVLEFGTITPLHVAYDLVFGGLQFTIMLLTKISRCYLGGFKRRPDPVNSLRLLAVHVIW